MNEPSYLSARRRICILTTGHLSTNPRLVKEADTLTNAGYEVSVIAADYMQWARKADCVFTDRQWSVVQALPFGPEAPRNLRMRQLLRRPIARVVAAAGLRTPGIVRAAGHPIGPDLVAAAIRVPADLYIAHYPPALPAAAIAARYHDASYAFDAEDFHLGDFPESVKYNGSRRLIRAIEGRYLPKSVYVSAASPGIADAYAKEYGIARPTVILNVFPRTHGPSQSTRTGCAIPGPSVYWFSQTIGPDRGLECAVDAIARSRFSPHLYLRGIPAGGFLEKLRRIAIEAGVGERVHTLSPELPVEMERLAASYDVGLVGETGHTPNRRIALTNKLFSFLLAGVPILMSDIPAHTALAPELGEAARLFISNDSKSLATALDEILESAVLASARKAAFQHGQSRYNWEKEEAVLVELVFKALSIDGSLGALC